MPVQALGEARRQGEPGGEIDGERLSSLTKITYRSDNDERLEPGIKC
jgi:hypothetical protein